MKGDDEGGSGGWVSGAWIRRHAAISKAKFAALKKAGSLPACAVLGPRSHRWRRSDVEAWLSGLVAAGRVGDLGWRSRPSISAGGERACD